MNKKEKTRGKSPYTGTIPVTYFQKRFINSRLIILLISGIKHILLLLTSASHSITVGAIAGGWYHHNIESNLDLRLPFVPQFLIIYFGCYVFWAVNYILAARQEREQVYRFFTADIISRCVCLIIFLAYPTTNTRPVIDGNRLSAASMEYSQPASRSQIPFPSITGLVLVVGYARNMIRHASSGSWTGSPTMWTG